MIAAGETPRCARGWTPRRAASLVERNALIYRRSLTPVLSSIVEPVLYLLSIGFGVGALVGRVQGIDVRYVAYVAPGILATTAMNAAFNQTSFGIFARIRNDRAYDAIVPTPLSVADIAAGEVASAVLSGALAAAGFVLVMLVLGLVVSPAVLLAVPGSLLVSFAFGAAGIAVMTYLRDFPDFQLVQLVMLPMFLFATTFYPLGVYPSWARPVIELLPLYQSIQLLREPALGTFHWDMLVAAAYLLAFGALALALATRRLGRKLLP